MKRIRGVFPGRINGAACPIRLQFWRLSCLARTAACRRSSSRPLIKDVAELPAKRRKPSGNVADSVEQLRRLRLVLAGQPGRGKRSRRRVSVATSS